MRGCARPWLRCAYRRAMLATPRPDVSDAREVMLWERAVELEGRGGTSTPGRGGNHKAINVRGGMVILERGGDGWRYAQGL